MDGAVILAGVFEIKRRPNTDRAIQQPLKQVIDSFGGGGTQGNVSNIYTYLCRLNSPMSTSVGT